MYPLVRQPSSFSVHSWWSDSNPNLKDSATINLHTVAKPLEKYFYHRQAVNMMKKKRHQPLDNELLEDYASYLPWNFVSTTTKSMVLDELGSRVSRNPSEAETVFKSRLFVRLQQLEELFGRADETLRPSSLQEAADALVQRVYVMTLARISRGQPLSSEVMEAFASLNLPWNFTSLEMILDCIEQQIRDDSEREPPSVLYPEIGDKPALEGDLEPPSVLCPEIGDKPELEPPSVLCPENQHKSDSELPAGLDPLPMISLARQHSRDTDSVYSWWSDSNPNLSAPTVYIFKPLKFLYHRQATRMIREHRGQPLSAEVLEVYSSYLGYKYILDSTKTMLLSDLYFRAMKSQSEALTMVDSSVFLVDLPYMQPKESDSHLESSELGPEEQVMQTAAKRLVKPLYHSLVCTFLEQNSGQPLSADILVKYVSYLQECCVPQSTKFTIVNDLYHRAKQVRGDAQAIIDSPVVLHLKQMLHTLDGQEGTVTLQTIIRFLMQELYHYQQTSNLSTMVREVLEGWTESESSNSDANLKQLFHAMLGGRIAA